MTDDAARKLTAVLAPGPDCQPIDELVSSMAGEHGEELSRSAQEHVSSCAHCKAELSLFQSFEAGEIRDDERAAVEAITARLRKNPPVPRQTWWTRLWEVKLWAPAGVALAAAALVMTLWIPRTTDRGPLVSGSEDTLRTHAVNVLSPVGDTQQVPTQLTWSPVAGAASYKVRLSEVDGTELWNGITTQTTISLPESIQHKLTPLKTVDWQVVAFTAAGQQIAESGTHHFRVLDSTR